MGTAALCERGGGGDAWAGGMLNAGAAAAAAATYRSRRAMSEMGENDATELCGLYGEAAKTPPSSVFRLPAAAVPAMGVLLGLTRPSEAMDWPR
jgi:hypothetical protein